MDFTIPKFHYTTYGTGSDGGNSEHMPFSFNFKHGVGCTISEGIKHCWACGNSAANSTKEMSPGAHINTLTYYCNY